MPPPPPLRTSPPSQYDVNFDGNVDYSEFMKILLDPDQYALFSVGESKAAMRKATALSDRDKVRHFYMVHRSKCRAPIHPLWGDPPCRGAWGTGSLKTCVESLPTLPF